MGTAPSSDIRYCNALEGTKRDGSTAIYRTKETQRQLLSYPEGFPTIKDVWARNFKECPNHEFLGYRPVENGKLQERFDYITFGEIKKKAEQIGSGIINLGLAPEIREYQDFALKMVAIYAKNSVEWILTDCAASLYGLTTVPIYDTLGEEACAFMFAQTNLTTCFLTCNHVKGIIASQRTGNCGALNTMVIMDEENLGADGLKELLDGCGMKWFTLSAVMKAGQAEVHEYANYPSEQCYTFSYTSGTTGEPKGAMMSHKNVLAACNGCNDLIKIENDGIRYLSYLPLAHVYERMLYNMVLYAQGKYAIFNGDVQKLAEDLKILQPTVFASVPRLYSRFYDTISGKTRNVTGMKRWLLDKGMSVKLDNLAKNGRTTHSMYDRLIFNQMKGALGGKCQLALTASAPIAIDVLNFLKVNLCCPILEAYGQTEGCGGEFFTLPNDGTSGHVGGPSGCNEFKLKDVPEMKYLSTDEDAQGRLAPRGEVCVRGDNVISGYYKNEEKTAETIDSEGWLMSGDIAMVLPGSNALKIVDRKKNIFKLSIGEYVAPDKLEQVFKLSRALADIFVYGDSLKGCLVAVVNIDTKEVSKMMEEQSMAPVEIADMYTNADVKKLVLKDMNDAATMGKLKGFERVKDVYMCPTMFAELDLLTTTFKVKRVEAKDKFIEEINILYTNLS